MLEALRCLAYEILDICIIVCSYVLRVNEPCPKDGNDVFKSHTHVQLSLAVAVAVGETMDAALCCSLTFTAYVPGF